MPYKPLSRPEQLRSLSSEKPSDGVSTKTTYGNAERAKLAAGAFMRVNSANDQSPPWGPGRSFTDQRMANPDSFGVWGKQFATTFTGNEFMAPPPPVADKANTETALSADEGPLA